MCLQCFSLLFGSGSYREMFTHWWSAEPKDSNYTSKVGTVSWVNYNMCIYVISLFICHITHTQMLLCTGERVELFFNLLLWKSIMLRVNLVLSRIDVFTKKTVVQYGIMPLNAQPYKYRPYLIWHNGSKCSYAVISKAWHFVEFIDTIICAQHGAPSSHPLPPAGSVFIPWNWTCHHVYHCKLCWGIQTVIK